MNLHSLWKGAQLYLIPSTSRRVAALLRRNRSQRRLIRALQREVHEVMLARRTLTRISLSYQQMYRKAEGERDAALSVVNRVKELLAGGNPEFGTDPKLIAAVDAWDRQREVSPR